MSWCAVPRRAVFCLLAAGLSFIPFQDTRAAEAISGFDFLSQQNQELQQDNFANPGYLWVEAGAARFAEDGCTDCHPQGSMRGVAVKFPRLDTATGLLENLETQINQCRTEQTKRKVYGYESQALLSLTTYISAQSAGLRWSLGSPAGSSGILPVALKTAMDRGEAYFRERRGQQNLSCAHCHEQNAGQRLRGEIISQGQINGYPAYRHVWGTLGSTHRLFAWCNEAVGAEPLMPGNQTWIELELYLRYRGQALKNESPAVRR